MKKFFYGLISGILVTGTMFMAYLYFVFGGYFSLDDLLMLNSLAGLVDSVYYEDVNARDLVDGAKAGIFSKLDAYSCYYTAEEFEEFNNDTGEEQFYGIGVSYSQNRYTLDHIVRDVFEGSPADKAGIEVDDVISAVDGVPINNMPAEDVSDLIRGEKGTSLDLTVVRGTDVFDVTVTRDEISVKNVEYERLSDKIGYIKIKNFMGDVVTEFEGAMTAVSDCDSLIIDLRSNTGGEVTALLGILDQIFPSGLVATYKSSLGDEAWTLENENTLNYNICVLIDGFSASCSEIFAGYVRDNKYATLIGTTTFGKGVVQSVIPLVNGGAVKLTTGYYETPGGHQIDENGIDPDIDVGLTGDALDEAVKFLGGVSCT